MGAFITYSDLRPHWHDTGHITLQRGLQYKNHGDPVALAAPSDLNIDGVGSNSVDLSWTDNSSDPPEERFELHRKTGAGPYDTVLDVAANETTFTDNTVEPSTTYSYKIRGVIGDGPDILSAFSNEVTGMTQSEG